MGCCTDMAEAIREKGAASIEMGAGALLKVKGPPKGALAEPAHQKLSYLPTRVSRHMAPIKIKTFLDACQYSGHKQGLKRILEVA